MITTIQALLGHQRLNTTITYARVHDQTVAQDYYAAMTLIEGKQTTVLAPNPVTEKVFTLLDKIGEAGLSDKQRQILDEVRRCLRP